MQYGIKHYFINAIGYLRGIKIDSIKQVGDTSVYYPFHTLRGNWSAPMSLLDSNGGSWLGKVVLQLNDGTFIFDNEWSDSIVIKTQAGVGDFWTFYKDSTSIYYKATVLSFDTMTVLGATDSIKRILITANDSLGIVSSDPLDSLQIILSKDHGFVQVFDLYTFPYHMPGGTYTPGLDFFLDKSTVSYQQIYSNSGYPPNKSISVFKIVNLINPDSQQLYTWHPGCIYEYRYCTAFDLPDCSNSYHYSVNPSAIATMSNPNILIDTTYMPEQYHQNHIFYFHSLDSSYCMFSPSYEIVPTYLNQAQSPFYFEGPVWQDVYKIGLGHVYSYYCAASSNWLDIISNELIYYSDSSNGDICGNYHPLNIETLDPNAEMSIYPNPTSSVFHIKTTQKIKVDILSIEGNIMLAQLDATNIDISSLANGMYFIKVYNDTGKLIQMTKLIKN